MNFMKRAGFVLTCATMLANLCAAQNTERTPQGMKCTTQGMDIRVEFYSPSIVRVYKTPEGKPYNKESLVVVKSPETVKVDFCLASKGFEQRQTRCHPDPFRIYRTTTLRLQHLE